MPISPTVVTGCVVAAAAVGPPIVGSVIDLIYKRSLDPSRAHAITANKSDRATATAVAHTIQPAGTQLRRETPPKAAL